MSTVATIISAVGYRLSGGITVSTTSDPSLAMFYQWLNEISLWIIGICAEQNSDLGRTLGTITTIAADITAATKAIPCEITAASHGLMSSGTAEVLIKDVSGMTDLNDTEYTATYVSGNAVTLGIDSSAYSTYTSGGYITKRKYSNLATTLYTPAQQGWIVKDGSRQPIDLKSENSLMDYSPTEASEPADFYVDGSNNICFPAYPDDVYTIKIPYWSLPTAITSTADTMPFLGLMDNVFIEAATIRAQNRDEYDLSFELKWQSFLLDRVRNVIAMRKRTRISVGV